jgi:hypothetical protein
MQSQLLYLAGSLGGVAAICGLCVLLFGAGAASLDEGSAQARLQADVAGFRPGRCTLAADKRSALVEDTRGGAVYLVVVRGDGLVTRRLADGFLRAAAQDGTALKLQFADFTFPRTRVDLGDAGLAADWRARLERGIA